MFTAFAEFRGLNGKVTRKYWKLQVTGSDETAFGLAQTATNALVGSLESISTAALNDYGFIYTEPQYAPGTGDLTEQALVNVWAEDPENTLDVLSISQIYVPAPVIGVFLGTSGPNMDIIDRSDTGLQNYVNQVSTFAFISDHEVIDTGTALNGIENGRRVTRKSR